MVADHMPWLTRILRARGGSSHNSKRFAKSIKVFSAHAEVVPVVFTGTHEFNVFSAHAEVVPPWPPLPRSKACILRARGGSSVCAHRYRMGVGYSPRTRR